MSNILEMATKKKEIKTIYFSKEDLQNLGAKDSVSEYIQGIIHQDKLLYIQVVVLPRLGFSQDTPFRVLDEAGKNALETNKEWKSFEVPAQSERLEVVVEKEQKKKGSKKNGKKEKSSSQKKKG